MKTKRIITTFAIATFVLIAGCSKDKDSPTPNPDGDVESNIPASAPEVLQYIFSDDFSSGDMSKTENGFTWGHGFRLTPSTKNPLSGTHSLECVYQGDDNPNNTNGTDSYLERSFNLGALYKEVVMEFDFYIPDGTEPWGGAAYDHRGTYGQGNNKFFRLWGSESKDGAIGINDYGSIEKIGAETRSMGDGGSYFYFLASTQTNTVAPKYPGGQNFITAVDLGNWMHVKIHMRFPTQKFSVNEDSDGFLHLYKDGVLFESIPLNNYHDNLAFDHAWQQGYILGWANSGMATDTFLFIDNFKVSGILK